MRNRIFITLVSILCFSSVFSQNKLTGKVLEIKGKGDTSELPGVLIKWLNTNTATFSNGKGVFELAYSDKMDTLVVSNVGYKADTLKVDTTQRFVVLYLSDIKTLDEVVVVYKSTGTEFSMMNAIKIETLGQRELMKAACCNLSESFETNPSIDVNFSDAVTGTKQIQMLGLSGQYALISKENMPYLRGLASIYGLSFIPGSWIQSIQLSKGAGTVINGYESFTGQINTELQNPAASERLFFNAYVNANARNEYNLNLSKKLTDVWSTGLLLHGNSNPLQQDMNHDGFLDIPTGTQINVANKWAYQTRKGFEGQFGGSYVSDKRQGGQAKQFVTMHHDTDLYTIGINTERFDVFAKNGYVFKKRQATSFGLQLNYSNHKQDNFYGNNLYKGDQSTAYANFIFQSYLGNTNHTYKLGASFIADDVKETYDEIDYKRKEIVPGTFVEYTYNYLEKFNLVGGLRADYHNYYGLFFTPRLHMRYAINDGKSVFRLSGGRALKTANIFAENTNLMASSRTFVITPGDFSMPYGMNPEIAWNYGANYTQKFKLDYRDAYVTVDVYRTDFKNQVVIDVDDHAQKVLFYNLKGVSFSNTAQVEFGWEAWKRLNIKTAYRFVDNQTSFSRELLAKSLISKHRSFINAGYETRNGKWLFDATLQWFGAKRLPNTAANPLEYHRATYSPDYYNTNAQITYVHKKKNEWNFYLGVENAFNYKQPNPIVSNDKPFGAYFDASMVWGSIYGRMLYGGLRFKIK
ncbi:MAG: TonB-dependent receptor [Bacteroidota bacterium]|nr:TonB-dependent receptor [Bacteroidota bacterium]